MTWTTYNLDDLAVNVEKITIYTKDNFKPSPLYNPFHNLNEDSKLKPFTLKNDDYFKFDLYHPIEMMVQASYDNSVNILFTDYKNRPRLINSKFQKVGNILEEVNHDGEWNTNTYDKDNFDNVTSLILKYNKSPRIEFQSVDIGGELLVGTYHIYIKYADADGNTTDFCATSGAIPCWAGGGNQKDGGYADLKANKVIRIKVTNLDPTYHFLKVFYSRVTCNEGDQNALTTYFEITDLYDIKEENGTLVSNIDINGTEITEERDETDINPALHNIEAAKSMTQVSDILFLGNLKTSKRDYTKLRDIAARFTVSFENINGKNASGASDETVFIYHNTPELIYNNVGYMANEYYKFGLVFLFKDNTYSPVFPLIGQYYDAESQKMQDIQGLPLFTEQGIPIYIDNTVLRNETEKSDIEITGIYQVLDKTALETYTPNVSQNYCVKLQLNNKDENGTELWGYFNDEDPNPNQLPNLKTRLEAEDIMGICLVRQKRFTHFISQGILNPVSNGIPLIRASINSSYDGYLKLGGLNDHLFKGKRPKDPGNFYMNSLFLYMNFFRGIFLNDGKDVSNQVYLRLSNDNKYYVPIPYSGFGFDFGALSVNEVEGSNRNTFTRSKLEDVSIRAWFGHPNENSSTTMPNGRSMSQNIIYCPDFFTNKGYYNQLFNQELKYESIRGAYQSKYDEDGKWYDAGYPAVSTVCNYWMGNYRFFASNINHFAYPSGSVAYTYRFIFQLVPESDPLSAKSIIILNQETYNWFIDNPNTLKRVRAGRKTLQSLWIKKSSNLETQEWFIYKDSEGSIVPTYNVSIYLKEYNTSDSNIETSTPGIIKLNTINEGIQGQTFNGNTFRNEAGNAARATSVVPIIKDAKSYKNGNLIASGVYVRGVYCPHLATDAKFSCFVPEGTEYIKGEVINDELKLSTSLSTIQEPFVDTALYYINLYTQIADEILIDQLKNDKNPYYPITDFYTPYEVKNLLLNTEIYRGDSFNCEFTNRIFNNFQDPSNIINDIIVDQDTWDNAKSTETYDDINIGDVNAVKMGLWYTYPIKSSHNLNIRSLDSSYTEEVAIAGPRTFYPYTEPSIDGASKILESRRYNTAFSQQVSSKKFFGISDAPYIRNDFKNRIIFSETNVNGQFINNWRVFKGDSYRDYPTTYGDIVKLESLPEKKELIIIYEHGVCGCNVNEKTLVTQADGDQVYISSEKVLPDEWTNVYSDTLGTCYSESVVRTAQGNIYGVDADAKKIWVCNKSGLQVISDLKIQSFLEKNLIQNKDLHKIPNTEYKDQIVKITDVTLKTHYNRIKHDVMFTYYCVETDIKQNTFQRYWSVCYNELYNIWTTFYSYIPIVSWVSGNVFYTMDLFKAQNMLGNSYDRPSVDGEAMEFWKHSYGDTSNYDEEIKPTNWYGVQYPFEFEFIVKDKLDQQYIFDNLIIISNKAKPESFHYEISGDGYVFSSDKLNMYFRQMATKNILRAYGTLNNEPIKYLTYNPKYVNLVSELTQNPRSYIFPNDYFGRKNLENQIQDDYVDRTHNINYDWNNVTGTEIIYDEYMGEFNILVHSKAQDIKPIDEERTSEYRYAKSHLLSNMQYYEDRWKVQIPPLVFYSRAKIEDPWISVNKDISIPKVHLGNYPIEKEEEVELDFSTISESTRDIHKYFVSLGYYGIETSQWKYKLNSNAATTDSWKQTRQEAKIRDKYIKIRIRYSGEEKVIIHKLLTLITESYAK